ncbi:MAG: 5'-nucleotidase, lipoprotein e(P4) family, partial [Bacteroidota bacterium]
MTKRKYSVAIAASLFFLCLTACRVQKNSSVTVQKSSLVEQGPLWGAVWQQKASEYKALCYQAYNIARLRIDMILQQQHSKPIAIVTDID